ncbi:GntR family transcriptional regulator [Streptomyces sp. NPDC008079]|uniref:GntR family transcriptional regulator n=1 Tax=Streptomyces sp. NPDC008079 TaxID=3364806 RepID=UPI0036F12922
MDADPDAEIDHGAPLTPYRQLAEIIRARVTRGDWAAGRMISSETQLVQEYGLARTTVRRAIAVLVEDGILFVVPQRGTFVAESAPPTDVDDA